VDNRAFDEVVDVLEAGDFYREGNRRIFRAIQKLFERKEPFDLLTVSEFLKTEGTLQDAGGAGYISSLVDDTPTSALIGHYASIVRKKSVLRQIIAIAGQISSEAFDSNSPVEEFIDSVESRVLGVAETSVKKHFVEINTIVKDVLKNIEELWENEKKIPGISTGFYELDRLTSGLHPGNLIVIAGRPGMGKTALALNIAEHVAVVQKLPVLVISLEMTSQELSERLLSSHSRIELKKLRAPRQNNMTNDDWAVLLEASDRLRRTQIAIDDSGGTNALELRGIARRVKRQFGDKLGLIVVDYLQLMSGHSSGSRTDNREQEISLISRSLKALAKELKVPIIALSQLNREPEKRTSKKPNMSDLRESGAIEQDADMVIFIFREFMYNRESRDTRTSEIILDKNRHGERGVFKLNFFGEFTRFDNHEGGEPPPGSQG